MKKFPLRPEMGVKDRSELLAAIAANRSTLQGAISEGFRFVVRARDAYFCFLDEPEMKASAKAVADSEGFIPVHGKLTANNLFWYQ
ncbi:hypothetical protein AB2D15_31250 [Pseudomonas aeruginosa]